MSWSISFRGSKAYVRIAVAGSQPYAGFHIEEKAQFERVKKCIMAAIEEISDSDAVDVVASGSLSVHIEGELRKVAWASMQIKVEPIRLTGMVPEPPPKDTVS